MKIELERVLASIEKERNRWGFTPEEFVRWLGSYTEYGDLGYFMLGKEHTPMQYDQMPSPEQAIEDGKKIIEFFCTEEKFQQILLEDAERRERAARGILHEEYFSCDNYLVSDCVYNHIPVAYPFKGLGEKKAHIGRDAVEHCRQLHQKLETLKTIECLEHNQEPD